MIPGPTPVLWRRGKVRDLYHWNDEIWLVASDRISAYDVVLPTLIPDKGKILTALARHWFEQTAALCPNHVLGYEAPQEVDCPDFTGRLTRAKRCEIVPLECVARGYLAGSAWAEYQQLGTVGGYPLPPGLLESAKLPQPLFTPARKNDYGHDENLSETQARAWVGPARYELLQDLTLRLYHWAAAYALPRGLILADTKFEFGLEPATRQILLADEILTPDSSRFWPTDCYEPGRTQESFDKQYLRDYLANLAWDRQSPGPKLPEEVVRQTARRYQEALARLTR